MELKLDSGSSEHPQFTRVIKRLKDRYGSLLGAVNCNLVLDTRMYEIEFVDGYKQAIWTIMIAENVFVSIDDEAHRHL